MVGSQTIEYLHSGGNRHPSTADWDEESGCLAFGSDQNVALWEPLSSSHIGILALLQGHSDTVNAVKFLPYRVRDQRILISGSSDCKVRLWQSAADEVQYKCANVLDAHKASINAIAATAGSRIFVTAAADSTVCIWRVNEDSDEICSLLHIQMLSPSYIPLTLCLHSFPGFESKHWWMLAVAGTRSAIQIFTLGLQEQTTCRLHATLSGHESWIRSLTATYSGRGDVLLASASQDKYVRLWRIKKVTGQAESLRKEHDDLVSSAHPLKSKVQLLEAADNRFAVTFEALLLGHDDWVYSAAWTGLPDSLQLLTTSADNSISIWEADEGSGIWTSVARLGEISEQKGSTTATGSSGGLWIGLWSSDGRAIVSLGRTGSWRLWQYNSETEYWDARVGIGGHTKSVSDVSWDSSGQYLLSLSLDQTSRLHAGWHRESNVTWHEFSRPQIHGYDLNCVASLGATRFVSGADEKLLRVFDEPKAIGKLLETLCGIKHESTSQLPEAADIPVLGLSNKAVEEQQDDSGEYEDEEPVQRPMRPQLDMNHPPLEDHLARNTLWPESEKLYGHGYEISAVASSHDNSVIATACKASSIDHAVIRLYSTDDWHEIKPSLQAHTLTIARLRFSPDDEYLLSVGRDRQWAIFRRDGSGPSTSYLFATSNPKGHARMILDAAWAPLNDQRIFATAGRDKTIKIWEFEDIETLSVSLVATVSRPSTVTAIDFASLWEDSSSPPRELVLAAGEEGGQISLHNIALNNWDVKTVIWDHSLCPSKAVTRLAWQPCPKEATHIDRVADIGRLAVASADSSVRLVRVML